MSYMDPINGISLERYAEIGAAITDYVSDRPRVLAYVESQGIRREDWEGAMAGWTARMQDLSLMGAVATAYMPLYHKALARRAQSGEGKAAPQATFDDYVAMSGLAKARGVPAMCVHYGIDSGQWTQLAMAWNQKIPTSPSYMAFGVLVEAEGARIAGRGAPKRVSFAAGGGAAAPQPPQAAPAGPAAAPGGGYAQGVKVLVQWSDGNRYEGTITQVGAGQHQVTFPNGAQHWVPEQYMERAG
jgi:hypothetical protein